MPDTDTDANSDKHQAAQNAHPHKDALEHGYADGYAHRHSHAHGHSYEYRNAYIHGYTYGVLDADTISNPNPVSGD